MASDNIAYAAVFGLLAIVALVGAAVVVFMRKGEKQVLNEAEPRQVRMTC